MTWRTVLITSTSKLDLKLNYLIIRGEELRRIHLSEIAVLILENTAISMTAALLCEMCRRNIKIIFCDERRNPYGELMPYYGSHDAADKLRIQCSWDDKTAGEVWAEIIKEKIKNQAWLLEEIGNLRASEHLLSFAEEVHPHDGTNREGHAAKVYFNALFGKDFSRGGDCAVNACLNYGYSILLSTVNREITAAGYYTQWGIFHDNASNPFNLGSDLMEPFRPLVDRCVKNMNPESLTVAEKTALVNVLNQEVTIDKKRNYLLNAMRIYCRSVFDAMNEQNPALLRFTE